MSAGNRKADTLTGAERASRWRARNPERSRAVRKSAYEKRKAWLVAIKEATGCADCGVADHRVLEFHHRDPADKSLAVSQLVSRASWARVMAEVEKCEVLCANCHRIRHYADELLEAEVART